MLLGEISRIIDILLPITNVLPAYFLYKAYLNYYESIKYYFVFVFSVMQYCPWA